MTRADVIKLFPDATDDQITAVLNAHHKEMNEEKAKAKDLQDNAEKVAQLQAQLDELNNKDLSELDKIQKQLEKVQADYDGAQRTIKNMELKTGLLDQGITGEDADKLIEAMNADKFDTSVIGTMIANAISAHDKQKLLETPDPKGAQGKPDTRSDAEKIAEQMFKGSSEQKTSVISNYL